MSNRTFNIGNVYERKGRLFLAVAENKLVTYGDTGNFEEYTTSQHHSHNDELSVGDLCEIWDIEIQELDVFVAPYFSPDKDAREKHHRKFHDNDEMDIIELD